VNILFIVLLGKRETLFVRVRLLWLRCESHIVSTYLLCTCTLIVYTFSPTSPARGSAHQLLNPQQPKCFKDVRQLVLHTVLLALGPHVVIGTHVCTYVCQQACYVLAQGESHEE
jgi:hypothetical protein